MPDLEISNLPALAGTSLQGTDPVAVADLSAAETKKITVKDFLEGGFDLVDDATIPAAKISGSTIGAGSVGTTELADLSVTAIKVAADAITFEKLQNVNTDILLGRSTAGTGVVEEITCTAAGRALLDDIDAAAQRVTLGLGTLATQDGTFSGTSSGTNTGDQTITLTGDVTGSGTGSFATTISAGAVGTAEIADASVTFAKTSFPDATIPGAKLVDDSVTSTQIAENAVGASELASAAVNTTSIVDGAVTDAKISTNIDGAKLADDTVTAAKIPATSLDRGLDKTTGDIGHTNAVTPGTANGITFDAQGHVTSTAALTASDMPVATTATIGAVSAAADSGLTVSGTGALSITNTLTGGTANGITFDDNGLITGTTGLAASDLPKATPSAIGGVSTPSSGGLEVDSAGALSLANSGVTAGTHAKVTVNARGIVTAGLNLVAADVPDLDASKITSGTINTARIANDSITGEKLADSSTVTFAGSVDTGGVVTFPTAYFTGEFFFDSINRDLYLWDGNAWQPVTITSGEIVFSGTYDASTNTVASVTTAGEAIGLTEGAALPAASSTNTQYYVVVSESGTGSAPAPAVSLNPPDILLSSGSDWELLDVSSFVASQQATNISFTPYGDIASNNVQTAIQELDNEKLPKAGGTLTGDLTLDTGASLLLTNGNTGEIDAATLSANRTYTFPDASGNIVTTGDSGTVTSAMIADGTIANGDISASAGIQFTKLENLTDAHILIGNSSNKAAAHTVSGDISISNDGEVAITAGSIVNADISGSAAIAASKIVSGTTSGAGVVQLSDSTTSTSTTLAATANAVKVTKDVADAALPKAGGTATGTLTFEINADTNAIKVENAGGTQDVIQIYKDASDNGNIDLDDSSGTNNIKFEGGTGDAYFAGEVGIGTASPSADLHISNATPEIRIQDSDGTNQFAQFRQSGSGTIYTSRNNTGAGPHIFQSYNGSGYTERFRINSDGNVGIGSSSPDAKLEIGRLGANWTGVAPATGTALFIHNGNNGTTSPANIQLSGGSASVSRIYFGDESDADIGQIEYDHSADSMDFRTNNNTRLTINSSGNVGIATTDPLLKLHVAGTTLSDVVDYASNQDAAYLIAGTDGWTGATTNWNTFGFQHRIKSNSGGVGRITVDTPNGEALCVTSTNRIGIGTTSPAATLDLNGNYTSNVTAVSALNIDCSDGNYFTKTINANSTFTFSNVPSSRAYSFTLELTHTSGTVTWPTSVEFPDDTAPTLTTGKTHLFMFVTDDGGTRFRGAALVDYDN